MNRQQRKLRKKRLELLHERRRERISRRAPRYTGLISLTPAGYGFVKVDPEEGRKNIEEIFIPPQYVNGALDGDRVEISELPERRDYRDNDRGPAGRVEKILEPGRQKVVGELLAGKRVRPLNRKMPENIFVKGSVKGASRGDWVEIKLNRSGNIEDGYNSNGELSGSVIRAIGKAGEISADLDAICAEFNLKSPYTEEEDKAALDLVPREIPRIDCRKLFTVTIDPVDAKDFDDAISLAPGEKPNEIEIGVHIADVAAYIVPRSAQDKGAEKRCFTAYLPGRTLPMLPKSLTAKISLREKCDSPAHSVFLTVDRDSGRILRTRRAHTLIRVNARLNYDEVQEFFLTGRKPESWTKTFAGKIKDFIAISSKMRENRRKEEDFINLEMPEIRVLCDEKTNTITGLAVKKQAEADFLVEECMLAANSAVGLEMVEKSIPGLFRVHPEPEPDKMEEFRGNMAQLFHISTGDLTVRKNCNAFIDSLPDDPKKQVILSMLLRSMPRASYSENNAIHFGLGKSHYVHFTSPIRRYTDLAVHQQLWNFDLNKRLRNKTYFSRLAITCSEAEKNNDDAFFAANDRLKLRYLEQQLEKSGENFFEAIVSRVSPQGISVEITGLGLYGFIPAEYLHGSYGKRGGRLISRRRDARAGSDREYTPGDFIYVKLDHIDMARGEAEFRPA